MKRIVVGAIILVVLISWAPLPAVSQQRLDLQTFFKDNIGLTPEQITAIKAGKPVAKTLKSRIPDEIFVFGAIYINGTTEEYVAFASDLNRLRKIPEYLAIGAFSNPPQVSDLKGFVLDKEDIEALKKCKTGDCDVQIGAGGMDEFKKSIDWSVPDPGPQVNQMLQKNVIKRLLEYQQQGNRALGAYHDKEEATVVADHFKYMLSYTKALPQALPAFFNYLLDYPAAKPAFVEDAFQWAKVKFGLKPTLRVLHIMTARESQPDGTAFIIAEKQLYSSHYFETALDLTFLRPSKQDPNKPGFYLIKAMGSEQAGLTGFKGGIVRKVAVSRSVSSLEKSLATIKKALEQQ